MLHKCKQFTHKQSNYFTIMLVPSSSGKTRSLSIPHWILHAAACGFALVFCVTTLLYSQSSHLKSVAVQMNSELEENERVTQSLMEERQDLSAKLLDEQRKKELTQSMVEREVNTAVQAKEDEIEAMKNYYEEKAKELETKLNELEQAKEEIYNKLSSKTYLPEITALASVNQSAAYLRLDTSQTPLGGVYETLNTKLDGSADEFSRLMAGIAEVSSYLNNYPTIWPVDGKTTSEVGYRQNPLGGDGGEYHTGIDICVPTGTPVKAAGGGTVKFSGWQRGFGYTVIISHGLGLETYYAHNSELAVSVGSTVQRGDVIASSGSTGISTGPHVHYEIHSSGNIVNPRDYVFDM